MFFNKYFNASNDEEVVISNEVHQQEEVVADVVTVKEEEVVADAADAAEQPKQQPHKYDAQFYFDEARYEKAYALAQSAQAHSQKALAEQNALAEVKALETQAKQASDTWFGVVNTNTDKNQNKYLYPHGVEPPMPAMPVLFIEEFVPPTPWSQSQYTKTDWRLYIFYDTTTKSYVLNGTRRRRGESKTLHPDIHMKFKSRTSLTFYLRKSTYAWRHDLSITMYSISRNVLHIISTPNAIPNFHSIHNCRSKFRSELFGYDNCRLSTRELKSYLKVLKDGTEGIMFK
jgi:hypothetical protein